MRVMSNVNVKVRMKQLVALIILVLIGILFALSADSKDQSKIKSNVVPSTSRPARV